jgi:Cytochrome c554 and c-prime
MRVGKRLGIILASAGVLTLFCFRSERATQARDIGRVSVGPPVPAYVGVPSCSARSCHGADSAVAEGRLLRDEYTTWNERDPHAIAYSVLFGARAQRIEKKLAPDSSAPVAAQSDPRCVACHCTPQVAAEPSLANRRVDGVSCEACHGLASIWINSHTASQWKDLPVAEKQRFGMNDVKNPAALAQSCVGCHVGAPAGPQGGALLRDVNHDMLAAGHPRLDFEFASFMANIPAHWKQTSTDAQRRDGAMPWAVGQLASARAALTLLTDRATRAKPGPHSAPWPEFAEYDCSSCHHGLTAPSSRQRHADRSKPPGQLSWGNWYLSIPAKLLADGPGEIKEFKDLETLLERPAPQLAETSKRASLALAALTRIEEQVSALSDQNLAATSLERLGRLSAPPNPCCWELAEQLSLSAAFLERATLIAKQPNKAGSDFLQQRAEVKKIFEKLAFPPGIDAKGDFYWDGDFERNLRALTSGEAKP